MKEAFIHKLAKHAGSLQMALWSSIFCVVWIGICIVYNILHGEAFNKALEGYDFHRVHESHLVAYAFISKVLNEDGGIVLTTDNVKIPISRRRKNDFQTWLKGFL